MKFRILSLVFAFMCIVAVSVNAQQAKFENHPMISSLIEDLNLTAEQQSKLHEIFEQHKAARKNNREAGENYARPNRGNIMLKVKEILTEEQIAQLEERRAEKPKTYPYGNKADWMQRKGGDWNASSRGAKCGNDKRAHYKKSTEHYALLKEMRIEFDDELKRKDKKTIAALRTEHANMKDEFRALKEEFRNTKDKSAAIEKMEALKIKFNDNDSKEQVDKLVEKYSPEINDIFAKYADQLNNLKGERSYKNPHSPGFKGKYMGCPSQRGIRSAEGSAGKKDCPKNACSPADCAKAGKTCTAEDCAKMGKSCSPADCKDKSSKFDKEFDDAEWKAKKEKMKQVKFLLMDPETEIETQEKSIEPIIAAVSEVKCYPNPAGTQTTVKYDIKNAGDISVEVRDERGTVVKTLVNEFKEEGTYTIELTTEDLNSSIYFITIIDQLGISSDKLVIYNK